MLQNITRTLEFSVPITEEVRADVTSYVSLLKTRGYVAQKCCVAKVSQSRPMITVDALACWPTLLSSAYRDSQVMAALDHVRVTHRAKSSVHYEEALGTSDLHYASEPPWARLQLESECIFGISPLKTTDGGIVARFVPTLNDELSLALWSWDLEYHCIYSCWLFSGMYEKWAERELMGKNSNLNMTGRALAGRLAAAMGCPVDYVHRSSTA